MSGFTVKARRVGGSLMVTIPKEFAREKGLREGQIVKIRVKGIKKSAFGALKGMKSFTLDDEMKAHG